ncbi:hypothetical protein ANCDUO_26664, partial [Ancylostoma duodenale]
DTDQEEVLVEVPESKDRKEKPAEDTDKGISKLLDDRARNEQAGEDRWQQEGKRSKNKKSRRSLKDFFTFKKSASNKEKPRSKRVQKSSLPPASKRREKVKPEDASGGTGKATVTGADSEATGQAPDGGTDRSLPKPKEQHPSPTSSRSAKVKRKGKSSKVMKETPTKDSKSQERPSAERISSEDVQKIDDNVASRSRSSHKGSERHTKPARSPSSSSKRHEKKTQHSREYTKEDSSSKSKKPRKKVNYADSGSIKKDADTHKDQSPPSPSERKHATFSRTYVTADESLKGKKHQK